MESGQLCKANYTPEVVNDYYLNCLIFQQSLQKDDEVGCICENTILPVKLVNEKIRVIVKCKQVTCVFLVLFMAPIVLHLHY